MNPMGRTRTLRAVPRRHRPRRRNQRGRRRLRLVPHPRLPLKVRRTLGAAHPGRGAAAYPRGSGGRSGEAEGGEAA